MNKNIIAIDMSTELCSVSIKYKKKIFTKYKFSKKKNSKYILKIIKLIIDKNNLSINKINYIFINKGPGSIIGTRISYNIAQIFKFKYKNIKIIKFNTFEIIREIYLKKKKEFYIIIYNSLLNINICYIKKKYIYLYKIKNLYKFQKKINLIIKNKNNKIIVNNYQLKKKILNFIPNKNKKKIKIIYPKSKYMIYIYLKKNYFK